MKVKTEYELDIKDVMYWVREALFEEEFSSSKASFSMFYIDKNGKEVELTEDNFVFRGTVEQID